MKTLTLWKEIITSPSRGYAELKKDSPLVLPLVTVLVLLTLSIALILPILQNSAYLEAAGRVQIQTLTEKGQTVSREQEQAIMEQMASPTVRTITLVSALAGGLITFVVMTLVSALLLKLFVLAFRGRIAYGLAFRILVFTALIAMVQALIKNGITLSGNWESALRRITDADGLQAVLQSPISLAVLTSPETLGKPGYYLLDTLTDIFNWIYYIFIFFAVRMSAGMEKKPALGVTLVFAGCSILIGGIMTLLT